MCSAPPCDGHKLRWSDIDVNILVRIQRVYPYPAAGQVEIGGPCDCEAFCSGADLSATDTSAIPPLILMRDVAAAAVALQSMKKPTIAKVDGPAVGAGLGMALACDLVVASERSRFSTGFSKRALSVDFATSWLLPRLIGMQRAKEMVLLSEMLDAEQALALGLVNRVEAPERLDEVVQGLVTQLLALPQMAVSMSKEMLNRSFEMTIEQALQVEAWAQVVNLGGPDMKEARSAFLEKREPLFRT